MELNPFRESAISSTNQTIPNFHGHHPMSCLFFKTQRFGDWILSQYCETNQLVPMYITSICLRTPGTPPIGFYCKRTFSAAFATVVYWFLVWDRSIQFAPTLLSLKIHSKIIVPLTFTRSFHVVR
jgi:hypothetical protein